MKVPFFTSRYQNEVYGEEIREKIDEVIKKGHFILGEEVKTFEKRLAEICGVKHAIGVGNGSDALYLAVKARKLKPGSRVITSPYTFFASTGCLVRNGLKPLFVDVDRDTYHIQAKDIEEHLAPDVSGFLSVDLFSHPADNSALHKLSQERSLAFIEDSAEAFGMSWDGKHVGTQSDAGVLSFFPTKTLGCYGDGGAILTQSDEIASFCRMGRLHGAEKKYHHKIVGINSRLDELQAGILNVKLKYVHHEIELRSRVAAAYSAGLADIPQIKLPVVSSKASPVWYVFAPLFERRDELSNFLTEKGIGSFVYWPKPMHLQECFKDLGYQKGDFPVAEEVCDKTLALPVFPGMQSGEIEYVIDSIKKFYRFN